MTTRRTPGPPPASPFDDPRITAFALGELPDADRAALAADLARDAALTAEVDAVRAIADNLAVAFFHEAAAPVGGLTERQRFMVRNAARRNNGRRWNALVERAHSWPALALLAAAITLFFLFSQSVGSAAVATQGWFAKVRDGGNISTLTSRTIADESRYGESPTLWKMMTGRGSSDGAPAPSYPASVGSAPVQPAAMADRTDSLSTNSPAQALNVQNTPAPPLPRTGGGKDPAADAPLVAPVSDPNRKIIKDAVLAIEVGDTIAALSRIDTIAVQSGGYILETLSDQGVDSGRPGATVKFAVPVDSFEEALGRLRAIGTVVHEQTSGVDVTTEFTDIQSRIANLEATQARVREFLAQAKTVEEALNVNARLTEIEGQLAQLKGRSTHLAGRAAYSTLTVTLMGPVPPTRTPTITPTPAPTATPTPGTAWSPAPIAKDAFATLGGLMKGLAAVAIWLIVVGLPIGLILVAGWWGVRGIVGGRRS